MQVSVFKMTQDDWCPSYECKDGTKLVLVSFFKLDLKPGKDIQEWRVCAWGKDDTGVELDFEDETAAWTTFLQVIGMEYVNQQDLIDREFYGA